MNARYYDSEIGRFLTMDSYVGNTSEPWPWHLYAYCDGDPVNVIDPSGHRPEKRVYDKVNRMYWTENMVRATLLTIIEGGYRIGYNASAELLLRSMTTANDIVYSNKSLVSLELSNIVKEYIRGRVSSYLKNPKYKNSIIINKLAGSYEITPKMNKDLFYAIHRLSFDISAKRVTANIWNLSVVGKDIFNFNGPFKKNINFTNILLNVGYAGQLMGIVEPFDVKIKFNYNYFFIPR